MLIFSPVICECWQDWLYTVTTVSQLTCVAHTIIKLYIIIILLCLHLRFVWESYRGLHCANVFLSCDSISGHLVLYTCIILCGFFVCLFLMSLNIILFIINALWN